MSILHIRPAHPQSSDENPGTENKPFRTINAAAALAQPGDTLMVHEGIYRERINPLRGGEVGQPITYEAVPGEKVCLRGSDLVQASWLTLENHPTLCRLPLSALTLGGAAYRGHCDPATFSDFNPFHLFFQRSRPARPKALALQDLEKRVRGLKTKLDDPDANGSGTEKLNLEKKLEALETELARRSRADNPQLFTTLGQLFLHGTPLTEVEYLSDLREIPGTWLVSPEGSELWVHFPENEGKPGLRELEISTRHTVFSPLKRGLGHITLRGFTIEHAANHFGSWGASNWGQCGMVSTRGGHHWTIEDCTIRLAKGSGIDCGGEGAKEKAEGGSPFPDLEHATVDWSKVGHHLIQNNHIVDNGLCGICGLGQTGTRLLYNHIERNNALGWTSPWWEFGGAKFHYFFEGRIEGNIIRDNEAHGLWLDCQFKGTRVTRNVILNNLWSGINLEYARGPVLVDNNIIALTRQGDGIYGHDSSEMTIAHNLLYANSNFGVWLAYCTNRVPAKDACWDHRILNNMILGNKLGAVSLPIPWAAAGNNLSDYNLLMGSGQNLDEGSGPFPPLFQFNNKSHCAQSPEVCPGPEPQTPEVVTRNLQTLMDQAQVPEALRPRMEHWYRGYLVNWEVWQAVLGNDQHSKSCWAVRDGLQSRNLSWVFPFDGTERTVECSRLPETDRDFHGRPIPEKPLPGPFQHLEKGDNKVVLIPRKL